MGLWLGSNVCISHACICGTPVDGLGLPAFISKQASGQIARYQVLNDVIARTFMSAWVPITKEPMELARQDGKQPDHLTLFCGSSASP